MALPLAEINPHSKGERGSALLIVFVFAAVIAIMLYREVPVAIFEAQRQKEQLLIDRGHEYVRGIQLFYRRNRGQFPSSIDQLESTNKIRYLRKRYTDPFTGKSDWRLIHVGPGGVLVDSKIRRQSGQLDTSVALGLSAQTSSTGDLDFHNPTSTSSFVGILPAPHQRPEMPVNDVIGVELARTPTSDALEQDPTTPLLPSRTDGPQSNPSSNGPDGISALESANTSQSVRAAGFGGQFSRGSSMGQIAGGGALAGIASNARRHTIKVVNDQHDYSLWEFTYDPLADIARRLPLGTPPTMSPPGASAPAIPTRGQKSLGP